MEQGLFSVPVLCFPVEQILFVDKELNLVWAHMFNATLGSENVFHAALLPSDSTIMEYVNTLPLQSLTLALCP